MVFINKERFQYILILLVLFTTLGCSNLSYIYNQGMGQLDIILNSRSNSDILKDPTVSLKDKRKIKLILTYKNFFYHYFNLPSTKMYSQTKILNRQAVSYLVIKSKINIVEAEKTCFYFIGCFPYLGFFKHEDAIAYAKKWDKTYFTYIRPVYAYSTLGYFDDRILSSFFVYNNFELSNMIFHELFHSIYFVKDKVSINENLAMFFAQKLVEIYFSGSEKYQVYKENQKKNRIVISAIQKLINEYTKILVDKKVSNKKESKKILVTFLKERFVPEIKKVCTVGVNCGFLKRNWNNASFSAFSTYRSKRNSIVEFYKKHHFNLKTFLKYLQKSGVKEIIKTSRVK